MASSATFPDAAAAADPRFREIFDYWQRKAPPGRLPGRQHIDPMEIRHLLPSIVLFDVLPQGTHFRFRWRLIGTAVVQAVGTDYTGRFIDEVILTADRYEALSAVLSEAVRGRQPQFWRTSINSSKERDFISIDRLALPLASDGESVDMLLGYYLPNTRATASAPPANSTGPTFIR